MDDQFCEWLLPILEKLSDKDRVLALERRLMVTSIPDAWERTSNEKILRASMPSSSEEEEEEEEDNDVEVVWAKSARGVWGLGHVFDGKLYS